MKVGEARSRPTESAVKYLCSTNTAYWLDYSGSVDISVQSPSGSLRLLFGRPVKDFSSERLQH